MKKDIKIRVLIFLLCVLITYLLFAFVTLHMDFRQWERPVRGFYAICQLFSVVIALAPNTNN